MSSSFFQHIFLRWYAVGFFFPKIKYGKIWELDHNIYTIHLMATNWNCIKKIFFACSVVMFYDICSKCVVFYWHISTPTNSSLVKIHFKIPFAVCPPVQGYLAGYLHVFHVWVTGKMTRPLSWASGRFNQAYKTYIQIPHFLNNWKKYKK